MQGGASDGQLGWRRGWRRGEALGTSGVSVKSGLDDTELGKPGGDAGGNFQIHSHPLYPPQLCQLNVGAPQEHQKHHLFAQFSPFTLEGKEDGVTQWKSQPAGTFAKAGEHRLPVGSDFPGGKMCSSQKYEHTTPNTKPQPQTKQ